MQNQRACGVNGGRIGLSSGAARVPQLEPRVVGDPIFVRSECWLDARLVVCPGSLVAKGTRAAVERRQMRPYPHTPARHQQRQQQQRAFGQETA